MKEGGTDVVITTGHRTYLGLKKRRKLIINRKEKRYE